MGLGASEGASGLPGLTRPLPAPYLLVYDAENAGCRGMIDWIQRRDASGLVVAFPLQNTELVHVAPELAGLYLATEIHGFDTRSREVHRGPRLLPSLFRRLPGWKWLAPVVAIPALASLLYSFLRRRR